MSHFSIVTVMLLFGFLPSGSEWIVILLVVLLFFGGKKIPELMKGVGKGIRSFKDGISEVREELEKEQTESESLWENQEETSFYECIMAILGGLILLGLVMIIISVLARKKRRKKKSKKRKAGK